MIASAVMERTKKPFDLNIEELAEAGRLAASEAVAIAKSKGVPVAGKQAESIGAAKPARIRRHVTLTQVKTG